MLVVLTAYAANHILSDSMSALIPYQSTSGRTFMVSSVLLGVAGLVLTLGLISGLTRKDRIVGKVPMKVDIASLELMEPTDSQLIAARTTEDELNPEPGLPEQPEPGMQPGELPDSAPTDGTLPPDSAPAGEKVNATDVTTQPPRPTPVPMSPVAGEPQNRVQELILQGRLLRDGGDMNGALTRFREAMAMEPRDPAPISELATAYEKMGLPERAAEHWKRIFDMGESAGIYYAAAEGRMRLSQAQALSGGRPAAGGGSLGPISSIKKDAVAGLGEITKEESAVLTGGEKLVLRVPLRVAAVGNFDVKAMTVQVLFYDALSNKTLEQTDAQVSYAWAKPPADWREGDTEVLLAEYARNPLESKEKNVDTRKYFGYVVRLYYKDILQDSRAEPARLATQFPPPQTLDKDKNP